MNGTGHVMPARVGSLLLALTLLTGPALADPVTIEDVRASEGANGWRFDVTLRHPDTGWDHYADGWQVLAPDGSVLGTRELAHPHVDEQPFTRSLSGIAVPQDADHVLIRARCLVDGWNEGTVRFDLPGR